MKNKTYLVPAVSKAIDILEYMAVHGTSEPILAISKQLKIPQASAFRIINTLISRGYLQKNDSNGQITLGARPLLLSLGVETRLQDYLSMADTAMRELLYSTGKTVELTHYSNDEITFVSILESKDPIRYMRKKGAPLIGSTNPVTLCVLAHLSPEERAALLSRMAVSRSHYKTANPDIEQIHFTTEVPGSLLDRVRAEGAAADFGRQTRDITRVAAPVVGPGGRILGTLGVAGPLFYMPEVRAAEFMNAVRVAARRLSERLGAPSGTTPSRSAA